MKKVIKNLIIKKIVNKIFHNKKNLFQKINKQLMNKINGLTNKVIL